MKSLRNWNMYCSCKFLNIQGQRDFYYLHIIIRLLFLFNSRSETREREKKNMTDRASYRIFPSR